MIFCIFCKYIKRFPQNIIYLDYFAYYCKCDNLLIFESKC